ncbi:hypothetical protein HX13_14475 [Chryseobacterium sp. P1-3]|nr:hypothetical protein HX13_14475 [Chryseobacterium sp. P1-3]
MHEFILIQIWQKKNGYQYLAIYQINIFQKGCKKRVTYRQHFQCSWALGTAFADLKAILTPHHL